MNQKELKKKNISAPGYALDQMVQHLTKSTAPEQFVTRLGPVVQPICYTLVCCECHIFKPLEKWVNLIYIVP